MTSTTESTHGTNQKIQHVDRVVIRFAGDSGDGMQVTGDQFTNESAIFGNDLSTLPNFPAEIRAPAGTMAGVSAFQVHISDHDILTPGDAPNILVAMNPAALRANVGDLPVGGTIVLNSDAFDERALGKAGYTADPLPDGSLSSFKVYEVPMTTLTIEACKPTGARPRDAERSKNFFALGLVSWLYQRPTDVTEQWIGVRYGTNQIVVDANRLAFRAGYNFGETAELFDSVNGGILQDPRVSIVFDAARRVLASDPDAYDIIAAAPSNPWISGAAGLYTRENFENARARLAPHPHRRAR